MLPIKEGCLAVSHSCVLPENNGVEVIVGKRLGELPRPWMPGTYWETDIIFTTNDGTRCNHMLENHLLRIDGGEFEEEETEELENKLENKKEVI